MVVHKNHLVQLINSALIKISTGKANYVEYLTSDRLITRVNRVFRATDLRVHVSKIQWHKDESYTGHELLLQLPDNSS